jgi:hypothetical protein
MTDVVDHERVATPTLSRLSRVRCLHCHMPAGAAHARCWSCGLDPTGPVGSDGQLDPATPEGNLPPHWHAALLVAGATALVLVALVGTVLRLGPEDDGRGLRGIAARLQGDAWERAGVGGASAEFPARPVRSSAAPLVGDGPSEVLVASTSRVRVELRATPLRGPVSPASLIDAYSAATGQEVRQSAPVFVSGAPGVDALTEGPQGLTRLRALVSPSTAYLLAVTGSAGAFERAAASLAPIA